jgi:peptide/nickel transport system permease protein
VSREAKVAAVLARSGSWRVRWGLAGFAAFAAVTLIVLALPLFAPYSATATPHAPFLPPQWGALFGSDDSGHDLFSRILYGMRTSWFQALGVVIAAAVVGTIIGTIAGTGVVWVDETLMRITDGFLALPPVLVAIAVVAALGPSGTHTLIGVSIVWWPYYARIVRGEVRSLRARPYVDAARVSGVRGVKLVMRHILPGVGPALAVAASLDIGYVILTVAGLSFIGLGSPAPAAELGAMTAQSMSYILTAWWLPIFPALVATLLAFVANVSGDRLARHMGRAL